MTKQILKLSVMSFTITFIGSFVAFGQESLFQTDCFPLAVGNYWEYHGRHAKSYGDYITYYDETIVRKNVEIVAKETHGDTALYTMRGIIETAPGNGSRITAIMVYTRLDSLLKTFDYISTFGKPDTQFRTIFSIGENVFIDGGFPGPLNWPATGYREDWDIFRPLDICYHDFSSSKSGDTIRVYRDSLIAPFAIVGYNFEYWFDGELPSKDSTIVIHNMKKEQIDSVVFLLLDKPPSKQQRMWFAPGIGYLGKQEQVDNMANYYFGHYDEILYKYGNRNDSGIKPHIISHRRNAHPFNHLVKQGRDAMAGSIYAINGKFLNAKNTVPKGIYLRKTEAGQGSVQTIVVP